MFGEHPEISSDLEWILLSGQASRAMLLETLVIDHGAAIHRLALAALQDADLAETASLQIFQRAWQHTKLYQPEEGIDTWLLKISFPIIRKLAKKLKPGGEEGSFQEDPLQIVLGRLGWKSRAALYLRYSFDYDIDQIASILKVSRKWVAHEYNQTHSSLFQDQLTAQPTEEIAKQLNSVWDSQGIDDTKLEAWLSAGDNQTPKRKRRPFISIRLKEGLAISAAILLVLLGSWLYSEWLPDPDQNSVAIAQATLDPTQVMQQITEPLVYTLLPGESLDDVARKLNVTREHLLNLNQLSPQAQLTAGQKILVNLGMLHNPAEEETPTPDDPEAVQAMLSEPQPGGANSPPDSRLKDLNQNSSAGEVLARWEISQSLWQSLFIEGQWVDYGPFNYLGPADNQRFQAWVLQPSSSLYKIGPLNSSPQETHLIHSGMHILSRSGEEKQLAWWESDSIPVMYSEPLRTILSPDEFSSKLDQQTLRIQGKSKIAGRTTIIVEALGIDPSKFYRVQIDVHTGILMNIQVFSSQNDTILAEIVVTQIQYDPKFEGETIFDALRLENSQFTQDFRFPFPDGLKISSSVEAVISHELRPTSSYAPAPQGFDPTASQVVFQYPDFSNAQASYSATTQIIADGYLLGAIPLPDFPQVICRRSEQGNMLALSFRVNDFGEISPGIQWFDLDEVETVYLSMPNFEIFDLAFRPDGKKLAVVARPLNSDEPGLYIHDFVTGDTQLLIQADQANHIRWKPDGQYISILGQESGEDQLAWMIVHIDTGLISYRVNLESGQIFNENSNLSSSQPIPPPEYPAWQWEINLLSSTDGLEACAFAG
jgi:DNA-directed RNA polymerase specialized sigma24 family protein/LysM repeat protein